MNKDEIAIRKLIETWLEASKNNDVKKVLSLMTDDVVFMVPGQEPFGKKEFKLRLEKMKDLKIGGVSDIKEIKIFGDWAYVRSYLKINSTSKEHSIKKSGYALTIFRKESDGWKLARDANLLV